MAVDVVIHDYLSHRRNSVEALESDLTKISVGGPQVFTRKEIVEMSFAALGRPPKFRSISPGVFKLMISPLRLINRRVYGLMDFGIAVTQTDSVAPSFGSHTLRRYFDEAAKTI